MIKLKTRQDFRKKHRQLILLVRLFMFIGFPLLYVLCSQQSSDNAIPHDIGFISRNLLVINENDTEAYNTTNYPFNEDNDNSSHIGHSSHVRNCTPPAIYEFPPDGFTREQRQQGWVLIHLFLSFYCFTLLAVVCDDYFVPAIEKMCHFFNISEDVAGATFMAAASSSPELFINCVGTFVTEGDLGVGTIVGSAVFNVLAVPACCGLLAGQYINLDWWAVTRDSLMYSVAVIALIFTLRDDKVQWYEAIILVTAYALYILALVFNKPISKAVKRVCCLKKQSPSYTEVSPLIPKDIEKSGQVEKESSQNGKLGIKDEKTDIESSTEIWKWPDLEVAIPGKLFWIVTWPINFLLWLTIPDCRKYPKLYLVTFFMCIVLIGTTSYMVAWLITVIGDTISIPDSVMGLTLLAAGTSVPEAVSSIIVTNQGMGSMGISSSIGSNTFDILLCLGLPWTIKSLAYPAVPGEYWVNINSSGLTYSAISLFSTLLGLYTSFAVNKFVLDWKIGLTCTLMYIGFLILASLIELNVLFPVNLPTCPH